VAHGEFREDLFYRLNVIPITIPTLTERREDIPALVKEFVHRYAPRTTIAVSADLIDRLSQYPWPGNIRELENLVERMVILRKADVLSAHDLPKDFGRAPVGVTRSAGEESTGHLTFHEAEEKIIREALDRCGWNRTKAAKYLNIPRHVLLYRMKKYKIEEARSRRT
jgi:two-component system NtrC family response regulator